MPIESNGLPATISFLDLEFSRLSFDEAVSEVSGRAARLEFSYVVTPNVDHIVKLQDEANNPVTSAFRAAYADAGLRLCDSRILATLATIFEIRLAVVTGSDLTAWLFKHVIGAGDRVAIVGGNTDMVKRLQRLFPGPDIVQHIPPMGMLSDPVAMELATEFVCGCKANYVLFATGAPQSEILAHQCATRGQAGGVGLCIGASIDFLLGDQRRAPRWMQRVGMEWAYRLASSPKRLWRRYMVEGPKVFVIAAKWWWASRSVPSRGMGPD